MPGPRGKCLFRISAFDGCDHLLCDLGRGLGVDVRTDLVGPLLRNGCTADIGEALALEALFLHHFFEGLLVDHGGGHECGGSDGDRVVLFHGFDDVGELDVTAGVDDVESSDLQHDGADILSDGVDVSLDGADDELSEGAGGCPAEVGVMISIPAFRALAADMMWGR